MDKLSFWRKGVVLVYFSFYQPLAAANDNIGQVHRGAVMLTAMFNTLLLLNVMVLIERKWAISLLDQGIPFILFMTVAIGGFHLFLLTKRKWQGQFTHLSQLSLPLKVGLGLIAFLGLPVLWVLFVWQASTLSLVVM